MTTPTEDTPVSERNASLIFDRNFRLVAPDEAGPEPTIREIIIRYYQQAFDYGPAVNLADRLIRAALQRAEGEL